jgi:heme a synthase
MKPQTNSSYNAFQKWGIVTVFFVYLLIAVGGIVRSTGAGMGCPDWPKCFGSWVPPTKVSQLPADYRETYADKRKQKNEKLAGYLDRLGFAEIGRRIHNDASVYVEEEFNATKTWIEYLNRLLGALVGVFIFGTVLFSFRYWKTDRLVALCSVFTLLLVGFQGWLGSVVVSTNLLPGIITVHMIVAIVIALLLIYAVVRSLNRPKYNTAIKNKRRINFVLLLSLAMSFVQVVLGTQVRQAIDWISDLLPLARYEWIGRLGWEFYVHRSFSSIILFTNAYLLWLAHKNVAKQSSAMFWAKFLFVAVVMEIAAGVSMAYFSIPAFLQPIHLLLAVVMIGIQFIIYLLLNPVGKAGLAFSKDTIFKEQNA